MTPETARRPWTNDEYIIVNNHRLVYTAGKLRKPIVHMPGGRKLTLEDLEAQGYKVKTPKVWRESEFI